MNLSKIKPMNLTERTRKLVDLVSSEFDQLISVESHIRFDKFLSIPDRIATFKGLCDGLTQEDMDSLGLDNYKKLTEHEFQVRDLVFELIEGTGNLPGGKITLARPALSGQTKELISRLADCCIANDWNTGELIVARIGTNVLDHNMQTPLIYAVGNCRLEAVEMLLRNGADPNLITPKLKTAMHCCATTICSQKIFNVLRQAGGAINIQDASGQTAAQLLEYHERGHWLREGQIKGNASL